MSVLSEKLEPVQKKIAPITHPRAKTTPIKWEQIQLCTTNLTNLLALKYCSKNLSTYIFHNIFRVLQGCGAGAGLF